MQVSAVGCDHDHVVEELRGRLIGPADAGRVADLFKLMADPTRVRLLQALHEAGELCVGDLAVAADIAESTASHALRLLRTAGVVRTRRSGRTIFYALDDDHVRELLERSLEHVRHRVVSD